MDVDIVQGLVYRSQNERHISLKNEIDFHTFMRRCSHTNKIVSLYKKVDVVILASPIGLQTAVFKP